MARKRHLVAPDPIVQTIQVDIDNYRYAIITENVPAEALARMHKMLDDWSKTDETFCIINVKPDQMIKFIRKSKKL